MMTIQSDGIPAAQVVTGSQLATGEQQPTVRQGPREAAVARSQLPRQVGRPKMPAFVWAQRSRDGKNRRKSPTAMKTERQAEVRR